MAAGTTVGQPGRGSGSAPEAAVRPRAGARCRRTRPGCTGCGRDAPATWPACVRLLRVVHYDSGYPVAWPDTPRTWLAEPEELRLLGRVERPRRGPRSRRAVPGRPGESVAVPLAGDGSAATPRSGAAVTRLFVRQRVRRQGIGTALLGTAVAEAHARGLTWCCRSRTRSTTRSGSTRRRAGGCCRWTCGAGAATGAGCCATWRTGALTLLDGRRMAGPQEPVDGTHDVRRADRGEDVEGVLGAGQLGVRPPAAWRSRAAARRTRGPGSTARACRGRRASRRSRGRPAVTRRTGRRPRRPRGRRPGRCWTSPAGRGSGRASPAPWCRSSRRSRRRRRTARPPGRVVSASSKPGWYSGSFGVSAASAVRWPPAEPPVIAT